MPEVDWSSVYLAISIISAFIFLCFAILSEIRKRKSDNLYLIPFCELRPKFIDISEQRDPGKRKVKGRFNLRIDVEIYLHGGKVLYPAFNSILTFKNSNKIGIGITRLIEATPVISKDKGGPWSINYTDLTSDEVNNIEYFYLMLECYDQLMRGYFTMAKFKYIKDKWAWNRIVFLTKRKRFWNRKLIDMFKDYSQAQKWIKNYGDKGILLQDWSELISDNKTNS